MRYASLHRSGDQPRGWIGSAPRRRALVWLAAAAISPLFFANLGCASASRWTAARWMGERHATEIAGDSAASIAATATADHSAVTEDPQVTEAFARLEQAQAEMLRRQSQAATNIAQANRQGSPSPAPPIGTEPQSKVR